MKKHSTVRDRNSKESYYAQNLIFLFTMIIVIGKELNLGVKRWNKDVLEFLQRGNVRMFNIYKL